jgi:hypothetical protein
MTDRLQQLCDEIRGLEPGERAEVQRLLDVHEAMPELEIERAWLSEARRRFEAMAAEAATAETVAAEDPEVARERLAAHLKRSRTAVPPRRSGR